MSGELVLSLSGQKEVCNYPDNNSNRGTICLLFAIQMHSHSHSLYLTMIMIRSLPLYWFHLADSLYLYWVMNLHFSICIAVFSISQSKLSLLGNSICLRGDSILAVIWLHWIYAALQWRLLLLVSFSDLENDLGLL